VKYQGRSMLVVGGASPQATLWGAYELLHRFGMRSLLQGDFPPVERRPFTVEGFDVVLERGVKTRAWQLLDGGPAGWEGWGLDDYRKLMRQLAKLKFNQILLPLGPTQPFFHYEVNGVRKTTGELFSGQKFSVDGDTAGRKAFRGVTSLRIPHFPAASPTTSAQKQELRWFGV
jgi:hypothetical protein